MDQLRPQHPAHDWHGLHTRFEHVVAATHGLWDRALEARGVAGELVSERLLALARRSGDGPPLPGPTRSTVPPVRSDEVERLRLTLQGRSVLDRAVTYLATQQAGSGPPRVRGSDEEDPADLTALLQARMEAGRQPRWPSGKDGGRPVS